MTTVRLMMPTDGNILGNVFGGAIMRYMDEVAGIVAFHHARKNVVTASIDRMDFYAPVYVGNLLILKAAVNYVGKTSMEVGVRIEAEDPLTGTTAHTGSCYLTFVALDGNGQAQPGRADHPGHARREEAVPRGLGQEEDEERQRSSA